MNSFRAALGLSGLSLGVFLVGRDNNVILNESKRQFYQDDASVVPIPGTIVPAAGTEIEAIGKNKIVNGISIRSPGRLEATFSSFRKAVNDLYQQAETKFYDVSTRYYETESKVTSQVAQLHEKREDLLPNGIYIIVGTLAGSIVARRRNIFVRALAPLVFGLATFKIFLPETFSNTAGLAWKLEQEKIPKVAETQRDVACKAGKLYKDVESTTESSRAAAQSLVHKSKKYVSQVTGLNLDQKVINDATTTTTNR